MTTPSVKSKAQSAYRVQKLEVRYKPYVETSYINETITRWLWIRTTFNDCISYMLTQSPATNIEWAWTHIVRLLQVYGAPTMDGKEDGKVLDRLCQPVAQHFDCQKLERGRTILGHMLKAVESTSLRRTDSLQPLLSWVDKRKPCY